MKANYVEFIITETEEGKTIRDFLLSFNVSKKTIYKQELFNLIRVNEELQKLTYRLKKEDKLSFKLAPLDQRVAPYKGEVDIIYEDNDILIVNKPVKLLIHSDGNSLNTLTNIISYHFHNIGYDYPILAAHRLDFDTSGIVLYAKHFISLAYLSKQFRENEVKKTYVAVCDNYFKKYDGVINAKIGKDRHSNKQMVLNSGKEARTEYYVLDQKNNRSFVELNIKEGRRHQIRVHLAHIGNPIIGDKLYGKTEHERMLLHAKKIEFTHPRTLKKVTFEVKEPF